MTPTPSDVQERATGPDPGSGKTSLTERARAFWARHRRLFWTLHTGWALATGITVVILARERYGFVPWVVGFLAVTWAATLFFGSRVEGRTGEEGRTGGADREDLDANVPGLREEVTSYATRTLYQETLFFLLPLYAHSTVLNSANVVFLAFLAGLALFSCIDLVFDRWLRTRPTFGLVFFSVVAFAALNLLLPILVGLDPRWATPIAGGLAVASAVPLALRGSAGGWWGRVRLAGAAVAVLTVAVWWTEIIPPVPLHTERVVLSSTMDRASLEPGGIVEGEATAYALDGSIYALFEVFAPASVPTRVRIRWSRDGTAIGTSRDVEITAHDWGFRVWDGWGPETGPVPPGSYEVQIETVDGRVFGGADLRVVDP